MDKNLQGKGQPQSQPSKPANEGYVRKGSGYNADSGHYTEKTTLSKPGTNPPPKK